MVVSSSTPSNDDTRTTATRTSRRESQGLRRSGLDLVGDVPWGTHFCQFYQTKQDLVDILVPYFKAGLESNEFCMWITSEPLLASDAEAALREAVPDLDLYLKDGQIEIIPHTEWYLLEGHFDQKRVLDGWIQKLNGALERGLEGLRLTGNTFWLRDEDWQGFTDYEAAINITIGGHRIIALCAYSAQKCDALGVADVVSNHEFALIKRQGKWSILHSSERKRFEEEIEVLGRFPSENPNPVMRVTRDGTILYANESSNPLLSSWRRSRGRLPKALRKPTIDALDSGASITVDYEIGGRAYSFVCAPVADRRYVNLYGLDITERRRAEEALRESQRDLRKAQAVARTGSWRMNVRQNELSWSDETYRMFGVPQGTPLTYEAFLDAVHTDDRELVDEAWKAGLRGEPYEVEHRIVVEGNIRWVRESAELEFDEQGELLGGFGTVQDITHHKQAAEALRQSESKLRRLAESGVVGIAYIDAGGGISDANDKFLNMVGYTRDDLSAGRVRWLDMTPPEWQPLSRQAQEEANAHGVCTPYEKEYIRKDGSRVPVLVGFARLEGSVTESIAFVLDLTERKQAEQELARARTHAEHHASEMESFFASMSDGAALFDAKGAVIMANEAAERMLGVPPGLSSDEWSKCYNLYSLDGELVPVEEWPSHRALRGEEFTDARYVVVTDWAEVTVSESGSPVRDSEGRIVGAVIVFRDIAQQIEFERRREEVYQREHHIAEVLQQALVPAEVKCRLPGIRISANYQSAMKEADVGGDFYDVFELGDGKLGVLIGDVIGKGLTAAIRVSAARYAVRSYALLEPDPALVLTLANRALVTDEVDISGMLTAFFAVFDVPNRTVDYASAGHEPPVVCTPEGEVIEFECFGMPLAVSENSAYEGYRLKLDPGDMVVMVTDGITEARSPQRGFFGKDGMNAHLHSSRPTSSEEAAEGLLRAALDHAGGSLHDDAAIVVVQLEPRVVTPLP